MEREKELFKTEKSFLSGLLTYTWNKLEPGKGDLNWRKKKKNITEGITENINRRSCAKAPGRAEGNQTLLQQKEEVEIPPTERD